MDVELKPKDHAEQVALFRADIIGALVRRDLARGERRAELVRLSGERYRPPGADHTRTYSFPTLERWYDAYRKGGLDALRPAPRSDRGRARDLPEQTRQLLLDIRRERPAASASLIVRTLVLDGRLQRDAVSVPTVRRLYLEHGLDRVPLRDSASPKTRLRWEAERPNALWHGDVCHGLSLSVDGTSRPLRIHAMLDDASRYVVALEAHHTEREIDMLGLFVAAVRRHGISDVLYLDNGSTYRGDMLRLATARLGVALVHARPRDPEARGKMERFWRTLREGCLDHLGPMASLHEVNVRLWAWLDQHYHAAPHASLMGSTPAAVYGRAPRTPDAIDERTLREAFTARARRRMRRDTTVSIDGRDWESDQGYLAGRLVTVARCLIDPSEAPWIEHDERRFVMHPVDPRANATGRRPPRRPRATATTPPVPTPFDPAGALLDRASGRAPRLAATKKVSR
jgi:putative transposase